MRTSASPLNPSRALFAASFIALIRLSSGPQVLQLGSIARGSIQQPNRFDVQSDGYFLKQIKRSVEITAFQAADGGAINTRINGQRFLSHLLGGPQCPEVPRHSLAQLHGCMGTILLRVYPSDISNIIGVRLKVALTKEEIE